MHELQPRIDDPTTWKRYRAKLCKTCRAGCCTLPVEVSIGDLIRMGVVDEFDREERPKTLGKRLEKLGIIQHFSPRTGLYTLTQFASGDCLYLDQQARRCTIYAKRPDTCRNHPQVGPRSGYCLYSPA